MEQVTEFLDRRGRRVRMRERHIHDAVNRDGLHPFGGLEQDEVALFGQALSGVRRAAGGLFFRAALRQRQDRGGVAVGARLGDDGLGAEVGFEQLAQVQRGALDPHALLAGDHAGEPRTLFRRVGPERPDNRRGQVVHDHVAVVVGRHVALVRDKGVAVLEDGDFLDGQFAERAPGERHSRLPGRPGPIPVRGPARRPNDWD